MLARRYEMPWRRAYESYAGIGWLAAMAFFVIVSPNFGPLTRP